ncbi:hypothetical protein B0H17DRAFT_1129327 [Mycena rosella]|uniref:Zinc finger PHD-type domain-containing protein n=1 Tax=Mycena rosella TaxID=1033263 RepID=A0AAD7DVI8_MYCRO|nr:hypothetical protein B0H17DRAFT_1129327 [Mycena rosella]
MAQKPLGSATSRLRNALNRLLDNSNGEMPDAAHLSLIKQSQARVEAAASILDLNRSIEDVSHLLPDSIKEATQDDEIHRVITTVQDANGRLHLIRRGEFGMLMVAKYVKSINWNAVGMNVAGALEKLRRVVKEMEILCGVDVLTVWKTAVPARKLSEVAAAEKGRQKATKKTPVVNKTSAGSIYGVSISREDDTADKTYKPKNAPEVSEDEEDNDLGDDDEPVETGEKRARRTIYDQISSAIPASFRRWLPDTANAAQWHQTLACRLRANTICDFHDEFTPIFSWLFDMFRLASRNGPRHNSHSFIHAYSLSFKSCVGSGVNHWQLSKLDPRPPLKLDTSNSKHFSGDLQKWFKNMTNIHAGPHSPIKGCWYSVEGETFCDGHATVLEIFVGLPVMLILTVNPGEENEWDVPREFSPIAKRPAALKDVGVVYDLVGHTQTNAAIQHFAAHFLSYDKKMYDYDGMKHDGHAILNAQGFEGSLIGKLSTLDVSPGFRVSELVYHLRGGVAAQRLFREEQSNRARKLGIEFGAPESSDWPIPVRANFTRPNTKMVDSDDMFWMLAGKDSEQIGLPFPRPCKLLPRKKRNRDRQHNPAIYSSSAQYLRHARKTHASFDHVTASLTRLERANRVYTRVGGMVGSAHAYRLISSSYLSSPHFILPIYIPTDSSLYVRPTASLHPEDSANSECAGDRHAGGSGPPHGNVVRGNASPYHVFAHVPVGSMFNGVELLKVISISLFSQRTLYLTCTFSLSIASPSASELGQNPQESGTSYLSTLSPTIPYIHYLSYSTGTRTTSLLSVPTPGLTHLLHQESNPLLDDSDGEEAARPPSQIESDFPFTCRCGAQGPDGSVFTVDDPAIQCDGFKDWSHIYCQRDGRAYKKKSSDLFECDYCIKNGILPNLHMDALDKYSGRPRRARNLSGARIGPGKGVLVKNGKYWYPARLIRRIPKSKSYAVKWWRECRFHHSATWSEELSIVPEADIVDDLWGNLAERRKIRLGKWTHACEVPSAEDILADPAAIPYNNEIETVLAPHHTTLQNLLASHTDFDKLDIPALQNISHPNGSMGLGGPQSGNLSILDQGRVIECRVANGDRAARVVWSGRIPLAHAYTLLFAHRYYPLIIAQKGCPPADEELEHRRFVLSRAWEYQSGTLPGLWNGLDVDRECLDLLEERMFENSERAGPAGIGQWGLDAGVHQGHRYPYNVPAPWSLDYAPEVTDKDFKTGPDFVEDDTEDEAKGAAEIEAERCKGLARLKPIPKGTKWKAEETETEVVGMQEEPEVSKPPVQKKRKTRETTTREGDYSRIPWADSDGPSVVPASLGSRHRVPGEDWVHSRWTAYFLSTTTVRASYELLEWVSSGVLVPSGTQWYSAVLAVTSVQSVEDKATTLRISFLAVSPLLLLLMQIVSLVAIARCVYNLRSLKKKIQFIVETRV